MAHRETLLRYITANPGKNDDEIARATGILPRQTVNICCRALEREGAIVRRKGPHNKLINLPSGLRPAPPAAEARPSVTGKDLAAISEDDVKRAILATLEARGWTVAVAWGKIRGADVIATRGQERWVIECKGTGSLAPMQNNYFVGVLGELLQRMDDPGTKHSIGLPDHPKFRRLWHELPQLTKQRLSLTALFVSLSGALAEVE